MNEITNWVAARRALRVVENLLRDDPENGALKTRLQQVTQAAEEANVALRAAVRAHGMTQAALAEQLRRVQL